MPQTPPNQPTPHPRRLYVLGIAPAVGTTTTAAALCAALHRRGRTVAVFKPLHTGAPLAHPNPAAPLTVDGLRQPVDAEAAEALNRLASLAGPPPAHVVGHTPTASLDPTDARLLLTAAGTPDAPLDLHSPHRYYPALEPAITARLRDETIDIHALSAAADTLAATADILVIDGCHGPLAPVAPGLPQLDLVTQLRAAVLLVAPSRPAIISPTLLAVEALASRNIPLTGVVLVRRDPTPAPEEAANPYWIDHLAGDLVRGVLPHFSPPQRADLDHLARRFEVHVDLDGVLDRLRCPDSER